jgi:hypothetical protein
MLTKLNLWKNQNEKCKNPTKQNLFCVVWCSCFWEGDSLNSTGLAILPVGHTQEYIEGLASLRVIDSPLQ